MTAATGTSLADGAPTGPTESSVADVGGIPISALVRAVPDPHAVIVALHGGATTSAYFDPPSRPRLSLLRTGAALGFTVIALDRPGYGASAAHTDRMTTPERRVDLVYSAVDRLLGSGPRGAGTFVLAHSMGCPLAVRMAADERGADLLGLEIAGIGRRANPLAAELMEARLHDREPPKDAPLGMRDIIWGPDHLYPGEVAGGAGLLSPSPRFEGAEIRAWPQTLPELAARVRTPVRYSLGDHEMVWAADPAAMADIAALFTAAPRVIVDRQPYAGHNLSLGLSATAYHLKVLSFVEECVLAREEADSAAARAPR